MTDQGVGFVTRFLEASGVAPQSDHCAICNWTRLLRSPLTVVRVTAPSAGHAIVVSRRALPVHALAQGCARFGARPRCGMAKVLSLFERSVIQQVSVATGPDA